MGNSNRASESDDDDSDDENSEERNVPPLRDLNDGHHLEYLFKVLVIGDRSVGKTTLIKKYTYTGFCHHHCFGQNSVEIDRKFIQFGENTVRLELWDDTLKDYAGSRAFYKDACGAIILFDLSRPKTLAHAKKLKTYIDSKVRLPDNTLIPVILLANKCDLAMPQNTIEHSQLDLFCSENDFRHWFKSSGKEGINLEESMNFLVAKIFELGEEAQTEPPSHPTACSSSNQHVHAPAHTPAHTPALLLSSENNTTGLSRAEFNRLTIFPFYRCEQEDSEKVKEKACSICCVDFEEGDSVVLTPCIHMYHSDCLWTWLKGNSPCPLCKQDLKKLVN